MLVPSKAVVRINLFARQRVPEVKLFVFELEERNAGKSRGNGRKPFTAANAPPTTVEFISTALLFCIGSTINASHSYDLISDLTMYTMW